MKKFLNIILYIPKKIGMGLVWIYQKCISPLLPHACKWTPTCSEYMFLSIDEFGFFKGFWLGLKRIFRCRPRAKGGLDPVKTNLKGDYKWLM